METDKSNVISIDNHELNELLKKDRKTAIRRMSVFLASTLAVLAVALFLSISIQGVIANLFMR